MAIGGMRTLPLSLPKDGQKAIYFLAFRRKKSTSVA